MIDTIRIKKLIDAIGRQGTVLCLLFQKTKLIIRIRRQRTVPCLLILKLQPKGLPDFPSILLQKDIEISPIRAEQDTRCLHRDGKVRGRIIVAERADPDLVLCVSADDLAARKED